MTRAPLRAVLLLALTAAWAHAGAEDTYTVDVDEQPLATALQVLAEQLDLQIVFFSGATEGLVAPSVTGYLTRSEAFDALLTGTDLQYVFLNDRSVAIQRIDPTPVPDEPTPVGDRSEAAIPRERPASPSDPPSAEFGMEEVIVTGTASRARTKFESSVGISTFDRADLARRAPSSTAELISAVPGFWVESTAGTTHGNVFARGIVQDGGYRYVGLIEDGLPAYPVFELSFYNPDQFIRVSESVARVEAVRGGTAPIFTSGAVGGTINFVNEAPSANRELRVKAGLSDYGARVVDMFWNSPVTNAWSMSGSGYVRHSDGIRDPGFVADSGGQLRLELRRLSPDSEIGIYGKYIDDRSLFSVPIPLRGSPSNPVAVDGTAAGTYSLHSNDVRRAWLPPSALEAGVRNDDLADGIHPSVLTAGLEYRRYWRPDLSLASHTRRTSGEVTFNALFTGEVPVAGSAFAAARGVAPAFSYLDGGYFDPSFLVQNHGHWAIFKEYEALQNDTRLSLSTRGHELALGIYLADFSMADRWSLGNLILMDVGSRPRRLSLDGVTDPSGFTRYSFLNLRADYDGRISALYFADEWELGDRLRLDFGMRYDWQEIDASISDGMSETDLDGDPATPWDVASLAGEDRRFMQTSIDHLGFSLGFNYAITDRHAAFGHFTRSAKLPHFDDVRNGILHEDVVSNLEVGYKASLDSLAVFLTAYRTEFDNVPFSDILVDGSIIVRRAETLTRGIELEGVYEPVDSVSMQFSVTLQDPEYRNFTGVSVDNDGNQVRRIPRTMLRVVPSVWFAAGRGRAFLAISHYGSRYANDENSIRLPSYTKMDAGVQYSLNESWSAQLNVDNLSNEVGLTEGNPRTDVGASGLGQLYNARTLFGRSLMLAVHYNFQAG